MNSSDASLSPWIHKLPHKTSMLLLSGVHELSCEAAKTQVDVSTSSSFHIAEHGVPAWVALEYIGQTAALIGVYSAQTGLIDATADYNSPAGQDSGQTEGFLLASRSMSFTRPWFRSGETLIICARQAGAAGASLATFEGEVSAATGEVLVTASLSVWRGDPDRDARANDQASTLDQAPQDRLVE